MQTGLVFFRRPRCTVVLGLLISLLLTPPVAAKDWQEVIQDLRVGGSARFRYEHKQNIKFGAERPGNNEDYFLTQFRLHAHWTPTDWLGLGV